MKTERTHAPLAIDRITAKVSALIRPTWVDFIQVGSEALIGTETEELRLYQRLQAVRDRGRAAATRLTVLATQPSAAEPRRYDQHIRQQTGGTDHA